MSVTSEITPFLKGQTILLTGASGFLGKVMLHKILAEAGQDSKVYALIRANKEGSAEKRLEQIYNTPIFEGLMRRNPDLKSCVTVLEGDVTKERLGLSESEWETVSSKVTTILHGAATTRFNEPLKNALDMNVHGTRRVLELAHRCKNLVSFVHISTAYVAADKPGQEIYEKVYPMRDDPIDMFEKITAMSWDEAQRRTDEIIAPFPNTYCYTKSITEHLIEKEKGSLPLCILRPSIVIAALQEPLPGWIDVMLGPTGLFVAAGMGALRVMRGNNDVSVDFIPVDIVCNAILVAAWLNTCPNEGEPAVPIYHLTTSTQNPIRLLWIRHVVPAYFRRYRPKRGFSYPFAFFCKSKSMFNFLHLCLHVLPATFVDISRVLTGKKMFMLNAAKRMLFGINAISHFTTNNWYFMNHNTDRLLSRLNEVDRRQYNSDVRSYDWDQYYMTMCHGMRKYLIKEDDEMHGISTAEKPLSVEAIKKFNSRPKVSFWSTILRLAFKSGVSVFTVALAIHLLKNNLWPRLKRIAS